ncbi:MAG: DUF4390 domain-containing protein [Rhodoferax sp.]|nr:DUF4390 domain-containing protein [Rhodoferax sp.]
MVFITRYYKNVKLEKVLRGLCLLGFCLLAALVRAQNATDISQFQVERIDDEIALSAQLDFELPAAVEDALLKGIPLFFVTELDLLRERWYWYDKKLSTLARHVRLTYQPLTRRWRIVVTTGTGDGGRLGLTLNQSFNTLPQALMGIKRVSRWKVADVSELDAKLKYRVEFRFRLDLNQLPRPFQIGAIGQSDWNIAATTSAPLPSISIK